MTSDTVQLSRLDIERLPNFKKKTREGEYSASCPLCGGQDRFLFWEKELNFWCRQCDLRGFITDSNTLAFDREAWLRWQAQETERKRQEQEAKQRNLDWLRKSGRADMYHYQMTDRSWWYAKGLDDATIDHFRFGFTSQCPTCPNSPSYTIPITYQGELYGIRHRLTNPDKAGKYRPEIAGLPSVVFNADAFRNDDWMVVIVEGEIKASVLVRHNLNAAGIPGANSFKEKWVKLLSEGQIVYIALDPDKQEEALKIAKVIKAAKIQVRLCSFPVKPDDFLTIYGGTPRDFMQFLKLGERV